MFRRSLMRASLRWVYGSILLSAPGWGQATRQVITSISVCSPTGVGGQGSCPSGSADTHQIVLAPDGSGNAINTFNAAAAADEHSSVFAPGTLGSNGDYLFFIASGSNGNPGIGTVVLSGGKGPDPKGQWTLDIPKTDGYGTYPGGFGQVFRQASSEANCPSVASGKAADQDATFDLNYAAPGSVVVDPTGPPGSLLMVYEGTNTCVGSTGGPRSGAGTGYISAAVATSLDYGKTWPTYRGTSTFRFVAMPGVNATQGPNLTMGATGDKVCMGNDCSATPPEAYGRYPVLMPPVSMATVMAAGQTLQGNMGDSQVSAFLDDVSGSAAPYLYLVHNYLPGSGGGSDLALARAQLNGGAAPLSFSKWNGQTFDTPGIGGAEAQLLPNGSFASCGAATQGRTGGSIEYLDATQQYLLLFTCRSDGDPAGGPPPGHGGNAWFYSTSTDLSDPTKWTTPQEIAGSWSETDSSGGCSLYKGWYPTWMSLDVKPGHLSTSGHVFYLWGCETGAGDTATPKRQFSSRSFTISTGPATPAISLVANAEGESAVIAPNTWLEIKGANLAPSDDSRIWKTADFTGNSMPVQLDQVSATVNGKSAYVYYISPSQVNILTPPEAMSGSVPVVVTVQGTASAAFSATAKAVSPSFFIFNGGPYVAAEHAKGGLIGPVTLYPGATTPAKPGEIIVIYANGFGPTNVPVTSGSASQSGTLSPLPVIQIGGVAAEVRFAGLVAPGEFQFNVVVPASLGDGDQSITATSAGASTQAGALLTVQH
jgi:uncharacterized protein (TIGR03437 family)